jgi:hypothetical protein
MNSEDTQVVPEGYFSCKCKVSIKGLSIGTKRFIMSIKIGRKRLCGYVGHHGEITTCCTKNNSAANSEDMPILPRRLILSKCKGFPPEQIGPS